MNRVLNRAVAVVGEYPMTLGGLAIGLVFAILVWTRVGAVENRVERIEKRVVVVERQQGADTPSRQLGACVVSKPRSAACVKVRRELRDVVLTPEERKRLAGLLTETRRKRTVRPKKAPATFGGGGRVNGPALPPRPAPVPAPTPAPPAPPAPKPATPAAPPPKPKPPVLDVQVKPPTGPPPPKPKAPALPEVTVETPAAGVKVGSDGGVEAQLPELPAPLPQAPPVSVPPVLSQVPPVDVPPVLPPTP